MKITYILILALMVTSCGIFPKKVEFGQSKVPIFPVKTEAQGERVKQGVRLAADKVDQAYEAAIYEHVTNTVIMPLKEAKAVINPVAEALGAPKYEWTAPATNLAKAINTDNATYDAKLETLEKKLEPLAGKKVEGTGWFQMGYFTYIALLLGLGFVVMMVMKVLALIYPPVSVGVNAMHVGSSLLQKGFSEVVAGGEAFKNMVEKQFEDKATQEKIVDLFTDTHKMVQSQDVQDVVKNLIK